MPVLPLQHLLVVTLLLASRTLRTSCFLEKEKLKKDLIGFVDKVTNFISMQKQFEDTKGEIATVDSNELVDELKSGIEKLFEDKKEKLVRVKRKAESLNESYTTVAPYTDNTDMRNMRDVEEGDNKTFIINPTFSLDVAVNMSNSYVHVPTNIYSKSPEVLSIVEWTEKLDEVFLENFEESNGTLLYQYYGDHSGFLRVYPGNNNSNVPTDVDLYDCRRRPWYVQSTSSPKDIVIIIDHSGSMIGSKIGIAKIATAALIDTLEENDFFNVISVSKEVSYMEPCLTYLLQATKRNKERIKNLVQNIPKPGNETDQLKGLKAAFALLNSSRSYNRSYANCNSAIVFITDGIESDYTQEKEIFDRENPERDTRVFTYLVGRTRNPNKKALVEMACDNRGFFYKLETIGNVWDTVMEYLDVMSRPLVSKIAEKEVLFTPAYLDSTGLGMVMSISMPVFDREERAFKGVVGTDITIKSLNDHVPHAQLGTFGHGFIITNNGFIVMHPEFRTQTGSLPASPNVLLEDLERAVDIEDIIRIKKAIIGSPMTNVSNENGENMFPVYFVYDKDRKISIINATYNYRNITGTEFGVGVAVAEGEMNLFNYNDDSETLLREGIRALNAPTVSTTTPNDTESEWTLVQVSPWNFVNLPSAEQETQPYSTKVYPTAAEIFENLKDVETWRELSDMVPENLFQRVKNLLISAAIAVGKAEAAWRTDEINNDIYESLFVATAAGYSRFFTFANKSETVCRDVLKSPIFQHALANPRTKLIFSAEYSEPPRHRYAKRRITAVAPITKKGMTIAVTGMIFKPEIMSEYLENNTKTQGGDCRDNTTVICALLDQNGFVIASNQGHKYIGSFIGEQSRFIVDKLVKIGVLKKIKYQDVQGECDRMDPPRASANMLLTPARIVVNALVLIVRVLATTSVQASLYIISTLQHYGKASTTNMPVVQTSCTKQMDFYLFSREGIDGFEGAGDKKVKCRDSQQCNMTIETVESVPDTNLVFLKVSINNDSCVRQCKELKKELKRTRTDFDYFCSSKTDLPKKQKYRRRPSTCFNDSREPESGNGKRTQKKKKYACGKASVVQPAVWGVLIITLLVMIMT